MLRHPSIENRARIASSSLSTRGQIVANAVAGLDPNGLDPYLDFYIRGGVSVEWSSTATYVHILTQPDYHDHIDVVVFSRRDGDGIRATFSDAFEAISYVRERMPSS